MPVHLNLASRRRRGSAARVAMGAASAFAGYGAGISSAHAAAEPLRALRSISADAMGLHRFARDVWFSGASLVEGVGSLPRLLGWSSFGFGVEHADGAACASMQGIGFALLATAALVAIAIGRMRLVSEHRRLDLARRLIERGMAPPDGLIVAPARGDLRRGVVLLCAGVGMCLAGLLLGDRGLGAGGLIPAFIGVGYLLSYRLAVGEGLGEDAPDPSGAGVRSRGDPDRRRER